MADQFHAAAGIGSSGNRWSTGRSTSIFDVPAMPTAASFSCSTDHLITNASSHAGGGFNWAADAAGLINMFEVKPRPFDESPGSNSSVTYQDVQAFSRPQASVSTPTPMLDAAAPCLMDIVLPSPTFDWSQCFFSSRSNGRGDQANSFQSLFQEDELESQLQAVMESSNLSSALSKGMNQGYPNEKQHPVSSSADNLELFPSSLLHGMLAPVESTHQTSFCANQSPEFTSSPVNCYEKAPSPQRLVKASQLKQHLQFSNATEACSGFYHSASTQLVQNERSGHSNLTGKVSTSHSNLTGKPNSRTRNSNATSEKTSCSERVEKKGRTETPSPLPIFKVRKEKLGDRITALQQIVSPFGKTDTASVLHEATDYIKFLHDQVRALSVPYLKNCHQVQQVKDSNTSNHCEGRNQDLQSRGLCLVPISSTFVVASETPIDFWTAMFGRAYS